MRLLCSVLFLLFQTHTFAQDYQIVIHGGAGDGLVAEAFDSSQIAAYHQQLEHALLEAAKVLESGKSAEFAVVAALEVLENSDLFNAGKGAVLTYEGEASLDASIMRGSDLSAGAVAGVKEIKNPIKAALAVLESSPHVLLSGSGADQFAKHIGLKTTTNDYFITPENQALLENYKKSSGNDLSQVNSDFKYGTVGCVVRDQNGEIAAGTSTGGMLAKRFGRIGDSPIIGAGTYANSKTVGVSCTGHGEYFIRHAIAFQLHAMIHYGSMPLRQASVMLIDEILLESGGKGGLIAIDAMGNISMVFNTAGMLRAYLKSGEKPESFIFEQK